MARPRLFLCLLLLLFSMSPPVAMSRAEAAETSLSAPGRQPGELERIQWHSSRLRGLPYLSTRLADGQPEPSQFTLAPVTVIPLDGDPQLNVRGNVYPIDTDGDGQFEFLHFNGYRLMRVYTATGSKLWQVDNPTGRVHRSSSHRDTLAVFDVDGDGGQDIIHCWRDPGVGTKLLVLRQGSTGKILKKVQVAGQGASTECHLAAFRIAGQAEPSILIAGKAASSACPKGNFVDSWSETIAFRPDLTKLWQQTTCAAGHYAWPLDEDGDGQAEQVFVGKYLLWPSGVVRCVLPGMGVDHVDSMVVADLDPALPGLETLTVGASGTRFYSASSCTLRWTIRNKAISRAQGATATHLDPNVAAPSLVVRTKHNTDQEGRESLPMRVYAINPKKQIIGSYTETDELFAAPFMNANLDGAPTVEDRVATFGQVVDGNGQRRLGVSWYWNLQQLTPEEEALDPADQWTRNPFAFDLDNDGRDELIVWGRYKLVVGTLAAPSDAPQRRQVPYGRSGLAKRARGH